MLDIEKLRDQLKKSVFQGTNMFRTLGLPKESYVF